MAAKRTSPVASMPRLAVFGAVVLLASACGGSSSSSSSSPSPSSPSPTPTATLQYVSVTGNFLVGSVGATTQLRAIANTSSGTQDVTGQATWSSSSDSIATVSSGGLVTAKTTGLVVISASYQGLTGAAGISVATAVSVSGTWRGTSSNPTADIAMQLTQSGDSISGSSTALGGGVTYTGSLSGTVNGGTVILAGSTYNPSGATYSTWTDERCALESANVMRCLNPITSQGSFTRMEVTFSRQ